MSQASPADPASLGIDVAQATFDAAVLIHGRLLQRSFAMTAHGFDALPTWIGKQGVEQAHACLEATGEDGAALALSLDEVGHVVSSVNPARIAASAKSRLVRTKTDKADAALIAHFCSTQHPVPWTPPPAAVRERQARVRRVERLQEMAQQEMAQQEMAQQEMAQQEMAQQEMAQQEVNRLHSGLHSPAVRASMEATLAFLRQEVDTMQRLVQEQREQSADRQHKHRLLCSIPGIGRWTAARVLAASEQVRTSVSARQLAAYAGLPPRERTSGTSVRRPARLAKTGNSRLRRALDLPAIVAMRHNPAVRAFAERLRARGTPPMVIVGAALRKLLHLIYGVLMIYGVLKSERPFDPALAMGA